MRNFLVIILGLSVVVWLFADDLVVSKEKPVDEKTREIDPNSGFRVLTSDETRVIVNKGTERAFSGIYDNFYEKGSYHCKRCDALLFKSEAKFKSGSGWPSFDEYVGDSVKEVVDDDGNRQEIVCRKCEGHLGHVFFGENYTKKGTRHCVNSLSLIFKPLEKEMKKAYFAGGCFWGVEHLMQKQEGVSTVVSGYMGGKKEFPTYKEVCTGETGYVEVVEVSYDPEKVSYETLAKLFFEIHDPTQKNGQGPDIGDQYLSVVFANDESEKKTIEKLKDLLTKKGLKIATQIREATKFYEAEDYHQDYYVKHKKEPYCHVYKKRFD